MKALYGILITCLCWASVMAAPTLPVHFEVDGLTPTTSPDEFGSPTRDAQGRLLIEEDGHWYYAMIDSSTSEQHLVKYTARELSGGIPDHLAAYNDPVYDARVREFNSFASDIVPVSGPIRITYILVSIGRPGQPANPDSFFYFNGHPMDQQKFHDQFFLENYDQTYPNDINQGWYNVPASANDWWRWASHGLSWLEPDESRYSNVPGYTAPFPGCLVDPATGGPFVFNNVNVSSAVVWETLRAAGIDMTLDPQRPICFVTSHGGLSFAHYHGWTNLSMEQFGNDSPLTIGVIVHELGHCVLQLPDLYMDNPQSSWQVMNHGCFGWYDEIMYRYNLGLPSDLCADYKDLVGWGEEPILITAPGTYEFDGTYVPYFFQNPNNPAEKMFLRSWDLEYPSFMRLHLPTAGGRLLIEPSSVNRSSWRFLDKPCPTILYADPDDGVVTWPFDEIQEPAFTWEDGTWFQWTINTANCDNDREMLSFTVSERPAPGVCVVMTDHQLREEVPLGGVEANFHFQNLGVSFTGWQLSIGGETVASNDTVAFNQTFEASFSSNVWGATTLCQVLDLPVSLYVQSLDSTVVVERLQPFVGLPSSNWVIPGGEQVIVETDHQFVATADEQVVSLYINGQPMNALDFNTDINDLCFAGDASHHLAVISEGELAMSRIQNNQLALTAGWPRTFNHVDAYALSDLSEYGLTAVVADANHLYGYSLADASEVFDVLLPDSLLPVTGLACASHDPAGDIGSRFCLTGGVNSKYLYLTNVLGEALYTRSAGDCGQLKDPISLDILGNGYYDFVVASLTCAGAQGGYTQEAWLISYSQSQGHHGIGIFTLGYNVPGYENGLEALVPYQAPAGSSHFAMMGNSYYPYSNSSTYFKWMDFGQGVPEFQMLGPMSTRRRYLFPLHFNLDNVSDCLMLDRGDGLRLWHGSGDDFTDQGKIHNYSSPNSCPVFAQGTDGDTRLGFLENGQLNFYNLGIDEWSSWFRPGGVGNQHWVANDAWVPNNAPLNPPVVRAEYFNTGAIRLQLEALPFGQESASYKVWFSTDQVEWSLLAEVPWNGQSNTSWVHSRAIWNCPKGWYQVTVTNVLDGSAFWGIWNDGIRAE